MGSEPVEHLDSISAEALAMRDRPLRIVGGARAMPAVARWSPAYLADRLGGIELAFKHSATGQHPNFHATTLAEMFARGRASARELIGLVTTGPVAERACRLFTGDEEPLVQRRAGTTKISAALAPLLDDVVMPAQIPPERLYTVWAWLGGAGARTWLHYDNNGCHNLNAQLTGDKTCVLFAPGELARLRPFPLGGANPAYNCSSLDIDALPAELADVPRFETRLDAGDLLFIPAWWLHAFHHHGAFNTNVNWWWKPDPPIDGPIARRQVLLDLVAAAGLKPQPGTPEAVLLARLDAAAIA